MRETGELRDRPAGAQLHAVLFDAEQRARVVDHMCATRAPLAAMAREIGLTTHRMRLFLAGVEVFDRDAERVDAWCEGRPLIYVPPAEVAILVLSNHGPACRRAADRRAIVDALLAVYGARGIRVPGFPVDATKGLPLAPG
jgi:hypothetical protein